MRHIFLAVFVLCAAIALADRPLPLVIQTDLGTIQGIALTSYPVNGYFGIPFAAPPVGDLRWRAPKSAASWKGVRDCTRKGPICGQPSSEASEDCLYLNVWAPNERKSELRPVSVWIHGGGLMGGGANTPEEDGSRIASTGGIVDVSCNYRLGELGFFSLPELRKEDPDYPSAGNYGLLDQRACLQWVQRNIAQFGGDPKQVTIFGESAGATSVSLHLVMPRSYSLYSSAIIQSNVMFEEVYDSQLEADSYGELVSASLGCALAEDELACLRQVPWRNIVVDRSWEGVGAKAVVDKYDLMENPFASFEHGRFHSVPLIAGNTRNEGSMVGFALEFVLEEDEYNELVLLFFGKKYGQEILDLYPCKAYNASDCRYALSEFTGDALLVCPTLSITNAYAAQRSERMNKKDVFAYVFSHTPSWKDDYNMRFAFHSSDVPFAFGMVENAHDTATPEEQVLEDHMVHYWSSFVNSSTSAKNPNWQGAPVVWPGFTPPNATVPQARANLNTPRSSIENNWKRDLCPFWESIWREKYGIASESSGKVRPEVQAEARKFTDALLDLYHSLLDLAKSRQKQHQLQYHQQPRK